MAVTESSKVSVLRLKFTVGKALSDLLETKADVIAKVDEADLEESM